LGVQKILLVDDNEEILSANMDYLVGQGYAVDCAGTGIKALACLDANRYDCIVLDVLLPDLGGFALCKAARTVTAAPILFLSCLEGSEDKVKGLMAGGDDYMSKPYSLKEFGARILAIMRRGEHRDRPQGNFYIDRENRIVHAKGKNVLLSEREFLLFKLLYEAPQKSFSREELLAKIWHGNAEISVVATLVSRLRRKIEFAENVFGKIISTYGAGYRLEREPSSLYC
jgi:DNA-binding response OmpR family regulator